MKMVVFSHCNVLLICLVTLCACSRKLPSQHPTADGKDLAIEARHMAVDKLNQLYVVDASNALLKYSEDLLPEYEYNNDLLGSITTIDVRNPLKILVFYQAFQHVIVLDNTLSEASRYDLQELGFQDITAVALSNDNQIWLYDPIDFTLKKISPSGQILEQSNSLVSEDLSQIQPSSVLEKENYVFVYDSAAGMLLFDNFGQYIRRIELPELRNFQVENGAILYFDGNHIHQYDLRLRQSSVVYKVDDRSNAVRMALINRKNRYLLYDEGIDVEDR